MLGLSALCELPLCALPDAVASTNWNDLLGGNILPKKRKKKPRELTWAEELELEKRDLPDVEEDATDEEMLVPQWLLEPEDDDEEARKRRRARAIRYLLLNQK